MTNSINSADFLIDFFEKKDCFLGNNKEEKLKVNYLEQKLIDSMGLVTLIILIEETFDIQLSAEELQSDEFLTIGGLSSIINSAISKN